MATNCCAHRKVHLYAPRSRAEVRRSTVADPIPIAYASQKAKGLAGPEEQYRVSMLEICCVEEQDYVVTLEPKAPCPIFFPSSSLRHDILSHGYGLGEVCSQRIVLRRLPAGAGADFANAQRYRLPSPDSTLELTVAVDSGITYALRSRGAALITPSALAMTTREHGTLGAQPTVQEVHRRTVDRTLRPVVPLKTATVPDHFNELRVDFEGGFSVAFRAYNEGVAYRFATRFSDSLTVESEKATFRLASGPSAAGSGPLELYMARDEGSFITHSESYYQPPRSIASPGT